MDSKKFASLMRSPLILSLLGWATGVVAVISFPAHSNGWNVLLVTAVVFMVLLAAAELVGFVWLKFGK